MFVQRPNPAIKSLGQGHYFSRTFHSDNTDVELGHKKMFVIAFFIVACRSSRSIYVWLENKRTNVLNGKNKTIARAKIKTLTIYIFLWIIVCIVLLIVLLETFKNPH